MVLTNTFTGLSEALHTVDVRAFDQANNVRTVSVTFTVDITDPIVNITSPADRALVGSAVVTWTGSDATSGIQGYQSRIDNGTWSTVAMTFTRTFTGIPTAVISCRSGPSTGPITCSPCRSTSPWTPRPLWSA